MKKIKHILLSTIIVALGFTSISSFAQSWSTIDGGGTYGISSTTSSNSNFPSVAVLNGTMYAIWQEYTGTVYEVHVKKYDGSSWTTAGNTAGSSLLYSSTYLLMYPKLVYYNNALYAAWSGFDAGIYVVHVKKYDGSSWTFSENYAVGDGRTNINNGITANSMKIDLCVFNNELYATWVEQDHLGGGFYNVRVSKFNGTTWTSVDGNGNYGINYSTAYSASFPTLCVFNNALYAAWEESNSSSSNIALHVRRYDGSSTWTFVDGNGVDGLNYSTSTPIADQPLSLSSYSGKMYAFWTENNRLRVKRYDETNGWTTDIDGGNGWNHNSTIGAYYPNSIIYNNLMYVTWEQNPIPRQVRVASFDGTTKTFIDGNVAAIGINNTTANRGHYPKLASYKGDLMAVWSEELTSTINSANQIRAKRYFLPPFAESVSVPANGTYIIGQTLNFTVTFSKDIVVSGGTPYIPITLNTGGTVNATYTGGTGTSALTFSYTVVSGNADTDGISVGTAISNGGATLQSEDATPLTANLTLNSVGNTSSVLVDGIAPVVSSINWQTPATSPTNATSLVYRVTFSKSVNNVDISDFTLTKTATATGTIASVTSSSGTTIDVTVNSVSGYGTLRLDLNSSGTGITDIPGNAINGGFTSGQIYSIYGASTATTNAASSITTTGATLNGTINANNASTTVTFDYGLDTGYGSSATATQSPVTGTSNTSVSAPLSGLTPNTTYHYRVIGVNSGGTTNGLDGSFTTTAALTSTFQTAGNWSLASNWSSGIPGSSTEVTISANCTVNGNFTTGNLIINSTAALTIPSGNTLNVIDLDLKSDNNGTASLINNGTLNASGTTTARRYMTGNKWHVVSPIAASGSISTFIQNIANAIPLKTTNYAMMDYNEAGNAWKIYYTAATTDILNSGQGYSIRRTADGIVTFNGTLTSGAKTVTLTKGGTEGWNSIGNPYPSSINMNDDANATSNFLKSNAGVLDGSYACVYVYDDDIKGYKILGNVSYPGRDLGMNVFAPGQGFFVKAASAGVSVTFDPTIQVHKTDAVLKSAQVTWPAITLSVANTQTSSAAVVAFDSRMTKGLDPTYDAGLLRGSNGLSVYTRLVDDNGVDFAIQCLPKSFDNMVIPVGVDYKAGGEITFSAKTIELPVASTLTLEDKSTGTFTQLTDGATYKATVAAGTSGIGRFYIHASGIVSALPVTTITSGLKAYLENGSIVITGEVGNSAKAYLFNMNGKNLGTFNLQEGIRNTINVSGFASGVYLLNVIEGKSSFTTKVVIH